jgi:hypothetical protein
MRKALAGERAFQFSGSLVERGWGGAGWGLFAQMAMQKATAQGSRISSILSG